MYDFSDLEEVELVVQKLIDRPEGALAQKLAAAPGMKEPRYAQTLGGVVEHIEMHAAPAAGSLADRVSTLEGEIARLREDVAELRRRLEAVL